MKLFRSKKTYILQHYLSKDSANDTFPLNLIGHTYSEYHIMQKIYQFITSRNTYFWPSQIQLYNLLTDWKKCNALYGKSASLLLK